MTGLIGESLDRKSVGSWPPRRRRRSNKITPHIDAGFEHLVFHGSGHDQNRFLRTFVEEVMLSYTVTLDRPLDVLFPRPVKAMLAAVRDGDGKTPMRR
ncbi:hypothetical protein [Rhodococcus koreensis]|uniref:hypothetical protein n=1 Tax=Rhodococcus koreensis TaxID=99653 RepID=UPI0036DB0CD8